MTSATARLDADEDALTIAEALRAEGLEPSAASAALGAATARRRARARWHDADRLLFTREALEQASDPSVSAWRARRLAGPGRDLLDLCAGAGGDTLALGALGSEVMAVDIDPSRLILLEHNAAVRAITVECFAGDALTVEIDGRRWVHADPGRRDGERRVRRLRDHKPPVDQLAERLRKAPGAGIVLSPAVDLEDPDLPDGEVEFVQLGADLVESVVWLGDARRGDAVSSCTLLPSGSHLARSSPLEQLPTGPVGAYLVQVQPAAVRARLHDGIGGDIAARRVASNRALLTTDSTPPVSPWYQARPVEEVLPARVKMIRRWLRSAPELPLEIVFHGIDGSPERWWRDLGRPPRGPQGRRLELVRSTDGALAVLTGPPPVPGPPGGAVSAANGGGDRDEPAAE